MTEFATIERARSMMFVPASKPKMLAGVEGLDADVVVLDLEDGVAPDLKNEARDSVVELRNDGFPRFERMWAVRINPPDTPWHEADMQAVAELKPPLVAIPKAEDASDVARICDRLAAHGTQTAIMLETAVGVGRVRELVAAHPSIAMLVLGAADLRRSLGARLDPDRRWEAYSLGEILIAARMHGKLAIDGVYFHFRDIDGLESAAGFSRDLGFDGKRCIHPSQIDSINRVYSSSEKEIEWANAVLQAWEAEDARGRSIIVVDGEMIELLHVDIARRILARAPNDDFWNT